MTSYRDYITVHVSRPIYSGQGGSKALDVT